MSEDLSAELGQAVVIENRAGANGIPASEYVARSPADGYTLLFTTLPAHAGNKSAYKKLPYDVLTDFSPVTVLSVASLVLVANPKLPSNNVPELLKLAKDSPGKLSYASFGVGGMAHLAGVQMNLLGHVDINHVPYKGGGPAMADVLGNHVDMYYSGISSSLALIKEGKLKPIAVTGTVRVKSLPNVPAVAETPGFEKFEASVAPIILAPAKTPREVVLRLQQAMLKVTSTDKFRAVLDTAGEGEPRALTPDQTTAAIKSEIDRLAALYKAAGIESE
jgi:tripartite-type tricarboxylate transporter receptor subunit TctC